MIGSEEWIAEARVDGRGRRLDVEGEGWRLDIVRFEVGVGVGVGVDVERTWTIPSLASPPSPSIRHVISFTFFFS